MKKRIAALLLALCMILLTGCSKELNIPEQIQSAIAEIADIDTEPKEFTEIDTPDGYTVLNSDMYSDDTVILLLGSETTSEYQVALYKMGEGLTTVYTGEFPVSYNDPDDYYLITLSVEPYVVLDNYQQYVYKFSDDFNDVNVFSCIDLEVYYFMYCQSRDSLLYTVSTEGACELREHSYITGQENTLIDFSDTYTYLDINAYYPKTDLVFLSGEEIFSEDYVGIIADLGEAAVVGQLDADLTLSDSSAEKICMTWYDDLETGNIFTSMINPTQENTGSVFAIDIANSIYYNATDEHFVSVEASMNGISDVKLYDIETGVLTHTGKLDLSELDGLRVPVEHDEVEPIDVYMGGSENYNYRNGRVLFNVFDEDYKIISVVIWDTSLAEVKHEYLTAAEPIEYPVYEVIEHEYSDGNTAYTETLETEYGINIFYGDETDGEFLNYNAELVYDEDKIEKGLKALEETLAMYPDGFFRNFSDSGYIRGVNFYLCGEFTATSDEGLSDAGAFTYTDSGFAIVVVDLNQKNELVANFCHEISHIIDERLISEGYFDEAVWNSYNPADFAYNDGYRDDEGEDFAESGSDEYTAFSESYYHSGDAESIYFIDTYSKTYATEDRARIMEYAMVPDAYTAEYFESSHLQAKLKYYSEAIRSCWESSGWVGNTQWEQFLFEVVG
ncbi:MAG: hypothetical protein E7456_01040 [Ruminococcaceae bacterium]|nr:hypothetical protein [Oscillospiraceae bacterium]